jgi:hypothetical protein
MPSPLINTVVRPWWSTYGWTLTDATTFRHMIRMAKDELVDVRADIKTFQELGDHKLALEMLEDAARAEEMVADMVDRLSTILSTPPKKRA